jgi:hypothetical protein
MARLQQLHHRRPKSSLSASGTSVVSARQYHRHRPHYAHNPPIQRFHHHQPAPDFKDGSTEKCQGGSGFKVGRSESFRLLDAVEVEREKNGEA